MEHLENHPHAFLDENNVVVAVYAFNTHDFEMLSSFVTSFNYAKFVCCCDYGKANIGDTFLGDKFDPYIPPEVLAWKNGVRESNVVE